MILIIMLCWTTVSLAEIYSWTDEKGIRHFSTTPPEDAVNVVRYDEFPHDVQKDTAVAREYEQWLKQIDQKEKNDSLERKKLAKRRRREEIQKAYWEAQKAKSEAQKAKSEAQKAIADALYRKKVRYSKIR